MKQNNKGFSLIELIVAIAILAVAGIAIFGFVVNTSNSYRQTNVDVKLQYEQQLAVNQIRDMIVESDKGIYFDAASKSLALYGADKKDAEGKKVYPVTVISYVQAEGKLYFWTKDYNADSEITFEDAFKDKSKLKLLSENVKEFNVDLTNVKKDKVQFQITFIVGEKEQTVKETVALRNRLVVSNNVDTIWGEDTEVVDSFIKGITIKRDTKTFTYGGSDTIGKDGSKPVTVVYSAVVVAKEESNRNYAVSWSLKNAPSGVGVSQDGIVTIGTNETTVTSSSSFELWATSVDDVTKSTYIRITVDDSGVYPESATLEIGGEIDGNGSRTYTLVPTLTYTNGSQKSDYDLFIWEVPENLPTGSDFDESTGKLVLTSDANGNHYTIKIKSKERDINGQPVYAERKISPTDIPKYSVRPSVKIAVSSVMERGGEVYPTMVFENSSSSGYTYDWWVDEYFDAESEEWNTGALANSDFNLVSFVENVNGRDIDYETITVTHTHHTKLGNRTAMLTCAPKLNWNKTFKIIIGGTATDKNGVVLEAEPKIVTINPVEIKIEPTNSSAIDWDQYIDKNGVKHVKPIYMGTVLRYEDWYIEGYEKGTKSAKDCETRRWFSFDPVNLSINGDNIGNYIWSKGWEIEYNYSFENQVNEMISEGNVTKPVEKRDYSRMKFGFGKSLSDWEKMNDRPVFMNFSITIKDKEGNSKTSNVEQFSIEYEFVEPAEE